MQNYHLVTICPNCRTKFKITYEQIKNLKSGLVTCGKCRCKFNAKDSLKKVKVLNKKKNKVNYDFVKSENKNFNNYGNNERNESNYLPEFIKQAEKNEFWKQPKIRLLMIIFIPILIIVFLAQIIINEQNKDVNKQNFSLFFCNLIKCKLEAKKSINNLSITGSSFVLEKYPYYRLDISLKNISKFKLITPNIELKLKDYQDKILIRKIINSKYINLSDELNPNNEFSGFSYIKIDKEKVNLEDIVGYEISIFYP